LTIYLLTGSNLGNRLVNINEASRLINKLIGSISQLSSVYETQPWGFDHNNKFLNQALKIESDLSPQSILEKTQYIEKVMGRKKQAVGYEARIIDIDILMYGDLIISENNLTIPHPGIHKRRFTLVPLAEIAPELTHPVLNENIPSILKTCPDQLEVKKYRL